MTENVLVPVKGKTYTSGREVRVVVFVGPERVHWKRPNGQKIHRVYRVSWAAWVQARSQTIQIS